MQYLQLGRKAISSLGKNDRSLLFARPDSQNKGSKLLASDRGEKYVRKKEFLYFSKRGKL